MSTGYWRGGNEWSSASNWKTTATGTTNVSTVPGASDIAYLRNSGGTSATYTNAAGGRSIGKISGNTYLASAFTIYGGTFITPATQSVNLGLSGIDLSTDSAANNLTFDSTAQISLTAANTPFNAGIRTIFVNSLISGTGFGITTYGAVTLQNGTTHIYTGTTTVQTGTLTLDSFLGANYANGLSLWIKSGAVCSLARNNVNGTGNGYQWIIEGTVSSNGVSQTLPFYMQLINGTMSGTGTATLGAFRVATGSSTSIDSTTTASTTGSISANIGIPSGSTLTFYVKDSKAISVSGILGTSAALSGSLVKASSGNDGGTLSLSGANIYTGGTTINAGTIKTSNLTALGTGAVTVSGSTSRLQTATAAVSGKLTIGGKLTVSSSGKLRVGG